MPKGILWAVLRSPLTVQPIFDNGQPHHITLFYDVEKKDWEQLIGIEFEATAIANIYNKDIQAIAMLMPKDIPHKANPHITVSYREGIEPVASNELLVNERDRIILSMNQKLSFEIEFFEFPVCPHEWVKNGTRNGVQRYKCKLCGANQTDGDRAKGRQKK